MNMHNETWKDQDSDRNDFDNNTTNSFSVDNNSNLENDDDDLDTDDDDYQTSEGEVTNDNKPNEIPEEGESENEGSGYHSQSEVDQPNRSADTSFSEQTDVTPPNKKEFPSVGPAKTDFEARPHGRTIGRMVGHEPGTEGI